MNVTFDPQTMDFDEAVQAAVAGHRHPADVRPHGLHPGDYIQPKFNRDYEIEIPECLFVEFFKHQPSDGNVWLKVRTRGVRNLLIVHKDRHLSVYPRVVGGEPGWPRPHRPFVQVDKDDVTQGCLSLPVPWSSSYEISRQFWSVFDDNKENATFDDELCNVCGEHVGDFRVMMRTYSSTKSDSTKLHTGGPALHARCALLTLKHCPHFIEERDHYLSTHGDTPQNRIAYYDTVFYIVPEGMGMTQLSFGGDMFLVDEATSVTYQQVKEQARAVSALR